MPQQCLQVHHHTEPAAKLSSGACTVLNCNFISSDFDVFQMMCTMYQKCKLIHADLSEYNMLWHDNKVWFIDVSQSVEPMHPHALEFLYRDCTNVVEFFTKCRVPDVLAAHELFNKVSQLDIAPNTDLDFLSQVCEIFVL